MKTARLVMCALIVCLLASCSSVQHYNKAKTASFAPDKVELFMTMSDYQYLGEVEISVDYKTYLGFITYTESVNEQPYNRYGEKQYVSLRGEKDFRIGRTLRKAMYKVLEAYPNADYYVPTSSVEKVEHMTLGKKVKKTAIVKCYKLK